MQLVIVKHKFLNFTNFTKWKIRIWKLYVQTKEIYWKTYIVWWRIFQFWTSGMHYWIPWFNWRRYMISLRVMYRRNLNSCSKWNIMTVYVTLNIVRNSFKELSFNYFLNRNVIFDKNNTTNFKCVLFWVLCVFMRFSKYSILKTSLVSFLWYRCSYLISIARARLKHRIPIEVLIRIYVGLLLISCVHSGS
jgi:hypothetical protein